MADFRPYPNGTSAAPLGPSIPASSAPLESLIDHPTAS